MKVAAIWRYPVKSMAGERLDSIAIDANGLTGDRIVQVYDRLDRVVTARRFPRLLRLKANQDNRVLRDIVRRFDGRICLNAFVTRQGLVREGDPVGIF